MKAVFVYEVTATTTTQELIDLVKAENYKQFCGSVDEFVIFNIDYDAINNLKVQINGGNIFNLEPGEGFEVGSTEVYTCKVFCDNGSCKVKFSCIA